jgi:hypothetical protein
MCTDGTLSTERTEPATAEAKHHQYEQWYEQVNTECDCNKADKCGDKYRAIVLNITAEGGINTKQQLKLLFFAAYNVSRYWRVSSKHYSKL